MKPSHAQWLKQLFALMEIPTPDSARQARRIETVEKNIVLPVKAVFIGMLGYSFSLSERPWIGLPSSTLDVTVETVIYSYWFYVAASLLFGGVVMLARRLPLAVVQWTVVTSGLVDGLFIAGLMMISGGASSILFWLFIPLIIRNAASIPPGFSQLILNFFACLCYVLVAVLELSALVSADTAVQDASAPEELGQPFALRLAVLGLTGLCCYGAHNLLERQRQAIEEAREFAAREGQLHSAGRLAAEFAHQIKNPLAIISNTAHSLQRAQQDHQGTAAQQIEIIQEEVARVDKVVTQIMGYAQLSEGRVEKLIVVEEIRRAIVQVFPPAVPTKIKIRYGYAPQFPPLLMQRGHLSEILVNLLQNAREALGDHGSIFVNAECHHDYTVEISVHDDGPGIAPEKIARIFEAYFTTKEKGTGLGLAIVKHNAELYGGMVRAESVLGKGSKFTVTLPARTMPKPFTNT